MASPAQSGPPPPHGRKPSSSGSSPAKVDPILRNALRYTVSAKEYKVLHKYLISRAPAVVQRKAPSVTRYEAIVAAAGDDYNAAAVRAAFRVFVASQAGLKVWDLITSRILQRTGKQRVKSKVPLYKSPNLRLSISLSSILLLHRLLFRFFTLLRQNLLTPSARPFRMRNPRISRVLVSRLAPAIGASLAGFMLGVYPADQLRVTVAIYVFTRALEFLYNKLEDDGWFKHKPWWFGSWLLMPISCGQLLQAFVFDRDCFPTAYGNFIMRHSPNYVQQRPADYPVDLPWPATYEIIDSIATMANLNYPPFISPILFPHHKAPLPASLSNISPITAPAHPTISHLTCALLHPNDPSCTRTHITYWLKSLPSTLRLFTLIYAALAIPRYRAFLSSPGVQLDKLARAILRISVFLTGAVGTAWGSICLFQSLLPRGFLPRSRFFIGGFLAGLWGYVDRVNGSANFLYSARMSVDSVWKVAVKRHWVKGVRGGDVWLFVASLMLVNGVFEARPSAVSGAVVRRGLNGLRGEGWADRITAVAEEGKKRKKSVDGRKEE